MLAHEAQEAVAALVCFYCCRFTIKIRRCRFQWRRSFTSGGTQHLLAHTKVLNLKPYLISVSCWLCMPAIVQKWLRNKALQKHGEYVYGEYWEIAPVVITLIWSWMILSWYYKLLPPSRIWTYFTISILHFRGAAVVHRWQLNFKCAAEHTCVWSTLSPNEN